MYPGTLESANTNEFGIVFADHIQGHRTVANLEALYKLSDAILSKTKNNTGNDAIGQEWYVVSEQSVYRLDDWANRKQASGWRKLQNVDTEFDSLQAHGADKIKNFTTTANDVTLNYNTWKNSETSTDGTAVIPAATGDKAGVLTADGKDQLDQLNKLAAVSHMKDGSIFTKSTSKLTFNYNCISTTGGATSAIETKYEDIPAATGDLAGVLTADGKDQLDQINKIGEVSHLKDGGVITTDATKATIHYSCVDTTAGATSAVVEKTADIPAASLTNAGVLAADQRNQLEQLTKLGVVSRINDSDDETTPTFTTTEDAVTLNYKNISSNAGANSAVVTKTANIPVASRTNAGIVDSTDIKRLDQVGKLGVVTHIDHNREGGAFSYDTSKVTLNYKCISVGADSEDNVQTFTSDITAASSSKAGAMAAADKVKLDTTLPNLINTETTNRQAQIRSISAELGFTENPTNTFNFTPTNKDLADKDTVTKAIDFLADEKYRSEMPDDLKVPNNIGGLKAGQTAEDLRKKSISQILDDIIFPELEPTITAPSASISFKSGFSNNQIFEVNATAPANPTNFTTGFNQGLSKVAGQPDKKRAGALNSGSSFIYYNTADQKTLPGKVVLGTMTYKYRAAYAQGETCVTSKGNKASSVDPNPLPAGTVDSGAIQIYGTYPYFCNGQSASSSAQDNNLPSSVTADTKLPLQKWTDTLVGAKFASEATTGTRLVFEFPSTKKVTKVEFMNTVSGKWENFSGYSTSTSGNKTIQGVSVAYSKLTTTGALSGAIQLRFTVANV